MRPLTQYESLAVDSLLINSYISDNDKNLIELVSSLDFRATKETDRIQDLISDRAAYIRYHTDAHKDTLEQTLAKTEHLANVAAPNLTENLTQYTTLSTEPIGELEDIYKNFGQRIHERQEKERKENESADKLTRESCIGTFIPIDSEQEHEVLNASLGYNGNSSVAYAKYACDKLGYKFIKEHKELYCHAKPKNSDHHVWLLGWDCEVIKNN